MSVVIITGAAGLIGSEAASYFGDMGFDVVGVDNDMRRKFFGPEASTTWNRARLERELGASYRHHDIDIRDRGLVLRIFKQYGNEIALVIHTAAQPSHDWAAKEPFTDFDINAVGTLNVLESTRIHAPEAVFIFTSTNKVYGDTPNRLPLVEREMRWEIEPGHAYAEGIREDMSIDATLHSLFGASKVGADVLVQEYGRYFEMRTVCFRGGTLTGPRHSATQLHGFLGYIMRCGMTGTHYTIYGYKGKQVRDIIHSSDVIRAFDAFFREPRAAEVYNLGGGRFSNASVIEAIGLVEEIVGGKLAHSYTDSNRVGDHIWWISNNGKFEKHYPGWRLEYDLGRIAKEMYEHNFERWKT